VIENFLQTMSLIRQFLCVLGLAVSAMPAMGAAPPNIILITLDTTRADRMGFLDSKRGLTPNLDVFARQSAVFTHAYSQAPLTPVSHATIFTGTYPQFHQVLDFPMPLVKDLPYAPDILHARGYHTAAFIGSLALDPAGGAPGFDRGFDTYFADFHSKEFLEKDRYKTVERRGEEVVAHALAWLKEHPQGPFFVWVHLYDPHDPYDAPEPYKTRYAKQPYDGEIAYVDAVVGKFFRELKTRGLYDGAAIAIMADHGESLGAHGEDTHGVFLYDDTIHVPLVIKLPHGGAVGKRLDARVELVDVLPTLLQVAGIEVPAEVQGESLLALMKAAKGEADGWRDRAAYSEADYPYLAYGWSVTEALRTGKYLYVQAPHRELYDQVADPNAEHNLAAQSTAVADTLGSRVEAFRQKTSSKREAAKVTVDPSTRDKLAALGYVASTNKLAITAATGQGPDPKDKIETANEIRRINTLFENGRFGEAIEPLKSLIVKEPRMGILYAKLGGSYMKLHQYDNAVPILRKAVELDPGYSMSQMDLGRSLLRVGQVEDAVTVFETITAKIPNLLDAQVFLEIAYARANRVPETIKQCQKVIEILPEHYGSYLALGRFLAKSGDPTAAIPKLEKAASLRPQSAEPHTSLAAVYDQLGRKEDAVRERVKAQQLGQSPEEE
jgi:arylsulfatase A-like enzyme/Tfp pilus assembly protein PilF